MADTKKYSYKYCIVPMCQSTTVKTPDNAFFRVPSDMNIRKKWCKLMRRDLIGPKSTKYVCGDHFDLENDTDNLIKYKLVGGTLKLKTGVFPHKFDCQKGVKPVKERGPYEKRLREDYFQYSLKNDVPSMSNCQSFEVIPCDLIPEKSEVLEDLLPEDCSVNVPDNQKQKFKDKKVQVDIKVRQKRKKVQTILNRGRRNVSQNKGTMTMHSSIPSKKLLSLPNTSL